MRISCQKNHAVNDHHLRITRRQVLPQSQRNAPTTLSTRYARICQQLSTHLQVQTLHQRVSNRRKLLPLQRYHRPQQNQQTRQRENIITQTPLSSEILTDQPKVPIVSQKQSKQS